MILNLNNSQNIVDQGGGKAYNLSKLIAAGFPVPEGLVVGNDLFRAFLVDQQVDQLVVNALNDCPGQDAALKEIRNRILYGDFPAGVLEEIVLRLKSLQVTRCAVRSSGNLEDLATASFAGVFTSVLNVSREQIGEAIKKVWASVFQPHVLAYLQERQLSFEAVKMGVIIQRMLDPEVSGVCFSINPVTNDLSETVVEAVWGLGEPLVSGAVTPDTYMIKNELNGRISSWPGEQEFAFYNRENGVEKIELTTKRASARKLSDDWIKMIAAIAAKLQEIERMPVDIEFVIADKKLYIVQVRPITTLN